MTTRKRRKRLCYVCGRAAPPGLRYHAECERVLKQMAEAHAPHRHDPDAGYERRLLRRGRSIVGGR